MNYFKIRQRVRQFESVTSLKVEEFDFLNAVFAERWIKFHRYHTIEGKKRKHPLNNPHKETRTLPSTEEKLFFVLVYLKNYSLQEMMSANFGFSQGNASKWIKILRPILYQSLAKLKLLPETRASHVANKLQDLNDLTKPQCFLDGTERVINKALDRETEEQFYSGKKKPTP